MLDKLEIFSSAFLKLRTDRRQGNGLHLARCHQAKKPLPMRLLLFEVLAQMMGAGWVKSSFDCLQLT